MKQPANLISLDDFRARAVKGEHPADITLRKGYTATEVKAVEGQDRVLRMRITTATRDRDRDTVAADGWRLANFRKNPVVLYGHAYGSLPIARDTRIEQDELGLVAFPHFVEPDIYPLGETVLRMLQGGYLNAASVGFQPMEWAYNEEECGLDFLEQELLEYSIVPVPANPEALHGAKSAGIDLLPIKGWAEQVLDEYHEEDGLWLPRKRIEELTADLRSLVVPVAGKSEDPAPKDDGKEAKKEGAEDPAAGTKDSKAGAKQTPVEDPPAPPRSDPEPTLHALAEQLRALAKSKGTDPAELMTQLAALVVPESTDDSGAPGVADDAEDDETEEALVFELAEDDAGEADGEEEFEVDPDLITAAVSSAVKDALGKKLIALTGRLD